MGANTLGTAMTKQLQQVSNSIAIQTEASQNSFQVLQNRALSDSTPFVPGNQCTCSLECCKFRCMQQQRWLCAGMEGSHEWHNIRRSQQSPNRARPCFKHSSNVAAAVIRYLQYRVYTPCACDTCYKESALTAATAWCVETIAQVRDGLSSEPELKSHPLGLSRVKVSELQSGWLVDALQERFPQAGVFLVTFSLQQAMLSSAKPTPSGAMSVTSQLVDPLMKQASASAFQVCIVCTVNSLHSRVSPYCILCLQSKYIHCMYDTYSV